MPAGNASPRRRLSGRLEIPARCDQWLSYVCVRSTLIVIASKAKQSSLLCCIDVTILSIFLQIPLIQFYILASLITCLEGFLSIRITWVRVLPQNITLQISFTTKYSWILKKQSKEKSKSKPGLDKKRLILFTQ